MKKLYVISLVALIVFMVSGCSSEESPNKEKTYNSYITDNAKDKTERTNNKEDISAEVSNGSDSVTVRAVQTRKMMYWPGRDGVVVGIYECDDNGNIQVLKSKLTSTTEYYSYDNEGNITKTERYNGDTLELEIEYDHQGRRKKRTDYKDGTVNKTYEYTYGDHDTIESTIITDSKGETIISENKSIYEYDNDGRVTVEKKDDGKNILILNSYEYDSAGNMIKSMNYRTERDDNTIRETREYNYDEEGRLVFEKVFDYEGYLTSWFAYEFSDGTGVVDENVRKEVEGEFYLEPVESIDMKEWIGKDLQEYLNTHPDYQISTLPEGYSYYYQGMSITSRNGTTIQAIEIWTDCDYSINGVKVGMNYKNNASRRFGVGGNVGESQVSDFEVVYFYNNGNDLVYELDEDGNIESIHFFYAGE